MKQQFRTGFGYDVHEFADGRKLFLGGIEIPCERGLLGHSDADVLLHAICDSILGALALGDIGEHFPNTHPDFKGIDSKLLLKNVYEKMISTGYALSNCDCTVVLEKPKLSPFIVEMRQTIAEILDVEFSQISIKATTSEGMGFVGRKEGAAAYATVLLIKKEN
ncbi:MAG: 2-C-methyl-D-erythritol 2,4-cyclodiphosphate synthase [Melioribacteraceae bacterium]|nr:2-C-methyl-D-erythritol 2,4-cyclodiphosphate synthase [Melioribacteraceae bacterium]